MLSLHSQVFIHISVPLDGDTTPLATVTIRLTPTLAWLNGTYRITETVWQDHMLREYTTHICTAYIYCLEEALLLTVLQSGDGFGFLNVPQTRLCQSASPSGVSMGPNVYLQYIHYSNFKALQYVLKESLLHQRDTKASQLLNLKLKSKSKSAAWNS